MFAPLWLQGDIYKKILLFLLILTPFVSIGVLRPQIAGDGLSYVQSIDVLKTGSIPENFIPNRLLTTYAGLVLVMLFESLFSSLSFAWLFLNSCLYVLAGLFFYALLKNIFNDAQLAFMGTLLFITNYCIVSFGLGYLMDMGGWTFYIISLYYSFEYLRQKEDKWLWIASGVVGIGGLFKEYAFLGFVVAAMSVILVHWRNWMDICKRLCIASCIVFVPVVLLNVYIYSIYEYSYFSWLANQEGLYPGQNIVIEYIKSFGSLYTFGWFLFVPGVYYFVKELKGVYYREDQYVSLLFVGLVVLSALPVFVWPVVTRVLFVTVPSLVLISCLFLREVGWKLKIFIPVFILYSIASYLMDSFILDFVNLPF